MQSTDSASVIDFFNERIFVRYGWPRTVISDGGAVFSSHLFQDFMERNRIQHTMASVEHPQTNGLAEKANFTIANALAAFVNMDHADWDVHVSAAVFVINTAKQETVKISSFELMFGRTAVTSTELAFPWPDDEPERKEDFFNKVWKWRRVARRLILSQPAKSKRAFDVYRKPAPVFHRVVYKKRRAEGRRRSLCSEPWDLIGC